VKRIVLVQPSGPRNVGMVLRTVVNFGPCELVLVAPERPSILIHPEFEQMSHGVSDVAERCTVVATLEQALADCTHAVGFTARVRGKRVRRDWRAIAPELVTRSDTAHERLGLVFGNEVAGLAAEHAAQCQELVHLATSAEHTSLNLAITVGIVLCALFTERGVAKPEPGGSMLDGQGREFLKSNMKHVFGGSVALTPAAKRDIVASIDRVISRAPLENRDARAWHLILRALGSEKTPQDFGLNPSPRAGARRSAAMDRATDLRPDDPEA